MFVNSIADKQRERQEIKAREEASLPPMGRAGARNTIEGLKFADSSVDNRTRQLEDYHDLCTSILEELKSYSYLVVPLIDDASKLARSQAIAKAVLSILKSTGSNEQKKMLSTALKTLSSSSAEETKAEMLKKFSRAEKISVWENKLDAIMEHGIDGIGSAPPPAQRQPGMSAAVAEAVAERLAEQEQEREPEGELEPEAKPVPHIQGQEYQDGIRDDKRMTMTVTENFVDLEGNFAQEWDPEGPETRFMRVAPRSVTLSSPAKPVTEKSGYLIKQGAKVKSWKNRWFILRLQTLSYYKSPQEAKSLGEIALSNVTRVEVLEYTKSDPSQPGAHSLVLHTDLRNYVLCSQSLQELQGWKQAIVQEMSSAITGPVPRLGGTKKVAGSGGAAVLSTCPICAKRFSKGQLIAHLDSQVCLVASPRSPRMAKSPRQVPVSPRGVLKRLADATKGRGSAGSSNSSPLGSSSEGLGIVSSPTGFKHESHTSEAGQVILQPEVDDIQKAPRSAEEEPSQQQGPSGGRASPPVPVPPSRSPGTPIPHRAKPLPPMKRAIGSPVGGSPLPVRPMKRAPRKPPPKRPLKKALKRKLPKRLKGKGKGGKSALKRRMRSASIGKAPLGQAPRPPTQQAPRPPAKRSAQLPAKAPGRKSNARLRSVSVGSGSKMVSQMRVLAARPVPQQKRQATAEVFEVCVSSAQTSPDVVQGVLRGRPSAGCWQYVRVLMGDSKRQTDTHAVTSSINFGKDSLHFPYDTPHQTVKIGLFLKRPETAPDLLGSCTMTVQEAIARNGVAKVTLLDHKAKVGSICIQCRVITRTAEGVVAMQRVVERGKLPHQPKSATLDALKKLHQQLFVELKKPDLNSLADRLRSGDIETLHRTDDGQDLLMLMCWLGDVSLVKQLLQTQEFDLRDRCNQRLACIHYAVLGGNSEVVEVLIKVSPQLASYPYYSLEPLHLAALSGHQSVVKSIIVSGANTDDKDVNGATPLMYAAFSGNVAMIETLLEMGAFLNCEDSEASSPLLIAVMCGHAAVVSLLLSKRVDVNCQNIQGECVVWCAIQSNDTMLLLDVLEKRADLELELGPYDHTVLQKAVLFLPDEGLPQLMSTLYKFCDINGTNLEDKSALFMACALGKVNSVNRLIKLGATVNFQDAYENIPLHFALTCEIAELLLQNGARVNQMNDEGVTPLHVACAFGLFDLKSCLLAHGADPTIRNCRGNSPLDLLSLSPPPDWKICMPFFSTDKNYVGGINIDDEQNPIHTGTSKAKLAAAASAANAKSQASSAGESVKRGLNKLRSQVTKLNQLI